MSDHTAISWTNATLDRAPSTEIIVSGVVAADEATRSSVIVVFREDLPATALAEDKRVALSGQSAPIPGPMAETVPRSSRHLKVLRPVVGLFMVPVVDHFVGLQRTSEHFLGHQPVLVDVAPHICQVMSDGLDEDVSIGRNGSPAEPIRILVESLSALLSHVCDYSTRLATPKQASGPRPGMQGDLLDWAFALREYPR